MNTTAAYLVRAIRAVQPSANAAEVRGFAEGLMSCRAKPETLGGTVKQRLALRKALRKHAAAMAAMAARFYTAGPAWTRSDAIRGSAGVTVEIECFDSADGFLCKRVSSAAHSPAPLIKCADLPLNTEYLRVTTIRYEDRGVREYTRTVLLATI